MSFSSTTKRDNSAERTIALLDELFGADTSARVGIRLWDGTAWPDEDPNRTWIVLKHPGSLRAMFWPPTELGLAEAYLYDDFDIEGNVEKIFGWAESIVDKVSSWRWRFRIGRELLRLPSGRNQQDGQRGRASLRGSRHSIERDRQAIAYHYDVSNDFYSLWLDKEMVYSCAYFRTAGDDLDIAQERKLDYICRKLRLSPDKRLLDVGCGWGGLVMHAAANYGVNATGITLSKQQAELANERISKRGLADRCRVKIQDYRQVDGRQPFDALVSVGMFEHVGETLLPTYFNQAYRLLKPGGVFLNHGIGRSIHERKTLGPSFSDTYVFPDGELVPIHVTLRAAEEANFEVRDVESLREHYAMTLRQWVHRLENNHKQALQYVDEPTYRVWRLFMSGSAHGFESTRLTVYQALLVKPGKGGGSGLPLTREDWYPDDSFDL
jgi:cyclopropane-fatty-acyl-phospholipid synthase